MLDFKCTDMNNKNDKEICSSIFVLENVSVWYTCLFCQEWLKNLTCCSIRGGDKVLFKYSETVA